MRARLLEFVKIEKREYQGNILTEIRDVVEAHSINLNVVFFYKTNWQNEGLRLQRRNKFICAMMLSMQEIGIEGPRMRLRGQKEDVPFYVQYPQPLPPFGNNSSSSESRPGPRSGSAARSTGREQPLTPIVGDHGQSSTLRGFSLRGGPRGRGESVSSIAKRVDFSLGMKDVVSSDLIGDVYDDSPRIRVPDITRTPASYGRSKISEETQDSAGPSSAVEESSSRSRFSLYRSATGSQSRARAAYGPIHRNRFFGSRDGHDDQDQSYENLMEQGMAVIPESGPGSVRLDPRSGLVSPVAVQTPSLSSITKEQGTESKKVRVNPTPTKEAFEMHNLD